MLGLFTQVGGCGALILLALFYLSNVPTQGVPAVGAEGAYLLVDKNLVEAAAVVALLAFRTGRIAGLDLLLPSRAAARNEEGWLS
jgi:thiosulfate dehydrogenase [quinone] large subunit